MNSCKKKESHYFKTIIIVILTVIIVKFSSRDTNNALVHVIIDNLVFV